MTRKRIPQFDLAHVRHGHPLQLEIYSVNERGASEKTKLPNVEVNPPAKHTGTTANQSKGIIKFWFFFYIDKNSAKEQAIDHFMKSNYLTFYNF